MASFRDTALGLLVSGSVIAAVVVSAVGRKFVAGPATLLVAGGASGFMATTNRRRRSTPVALTYQHDTPETMRSTISIFFVVGALMSLVGLVLAGEVRSPVS